MRALAGVVVGALGALACGQRGAPEIERAEDAGAGVVIVHRTADGVRLVDEVEPNDAVAQAMDVVLPAGVQGALASSDDVDRYRVAVETPGALYVEIGGLAGIDLIVEITDREGAVLAHCDNGPAEVGEGFPNFPVERGEYFVVVREFVKKQRARRRKGTKAEEPEVAGRQGDSPPYTLTIKRTPAPLDTQELEPNSTPEAARPVVVGGEVRGYVGWRRDLDYWALPIDGLGEGDVLDIEVDGVQGVELSVELLRGTQPVLTRAGASGQGVALRGWTPSGDRDEPRYLTVGGKRSSFEEPYIVRVLRRTAGFDEETEPNDTPATAATLAVSPGVASGARRGHLTPGDVDVYAVPIAPSGQQLDVVVEPGAPSIDVAVALLDEGGATVAEADATQRGGAERLEGVAIAAGARTYVRVTRKSFKDSADEDAVAPYALRWSLTGGAVIPPAMFE